MKASEFSLSEYFQRVANGLQKECGEKPYSIKVKDDSSFVARHYQS